MLAWIFDLDNTLHDARPQVFPHINRWMTEFVARELALDEEAASEVRRRYWKRYGATLLGMMVNHGTDPQRFLRETHRFEDLDRIVSRERGLRHALVRLPGRRIVFSNSPDHYARAVLAALRIDDLFEEVVAIEHTGYRPKPDAWGFLQILRRIRLPAHRCIMVEDTLENLRTAKRLGMKTVWVTAATRAPDCVDARLRSVRELPRFASQFAGRQSAHRLHA